jgi:PAS domain S-box-containing protein
MKGKMMKKWSINRVYRIPLIYGLFSVLWIIFSDKFAFLVAPDAQRAELYSTIKGLVFVVLSTLLIYFLLRYDETSKEKILVEMAAVQKSFNLLFEGNTQPMWIYNNQTLEIMAVNEAACRVYGYSQPEFTKLKVSDLRSEEDLPLFLQLLNENKEGLRQTGPWRHLKRNGDHLVVEVISLPLRSAGLDSTLVSIVDMTEQQKNREELATALQERDDFESFGYTVSHDLKAPLRAVVGYSDLMEKQYAPKMDDEGKFFIEQIRNAGNTMNEMLDDLLALTGISHRPFLRERVDLSELVLGLLNEAQRNELDRKVAVIVEPGMLVSADRGTLKPALQNLVQNAWKYTRQNDQARIEVGSTTHNGDEKVYYFKDNGIGFDPSYANMVFEPFKRAHMNIPHEGMGIGLSIVRRAIERHGGRIWVEAESEKGATFYFTLPDKAAGDI